MWFIVADAKSKVVDEFKPVAIGLALMMMIMSDMQGLFYLISASSHELDVIDSHGNFVAKLEIDEYIEETCCQGQTLAVITSDPDQLLIGGIKGIKQTIEVCSLSKVGMSPDESRIAVFSPLHRSRYGLCKFSQFLS